MNLKAIKDEYKDSLNLLADVTKILNAKRIELNQIDEEKNKSIEIKNSIDREVNTLYQSVDKIKASINDYNLLKERYLRELYFLNTRISEKELNIASHKNLTSIEINKIEALKQLRSNENKSLKKIKKEVEKEFLLKEQKDKEILSANKELEQVKQKIQSQLIELESKSNMLTRKEEGLKNFEMFLTREKARLDSIVNKLKEFANKNNLSLNI